MNLIFDAPINNLSFGNVSFNLLRELYKKETKLSIFPKSENDFTAFDKIDKDFKGWIDNAITYRYHNLNPDLPSLNLWHLNGCEKRVSRRQFLLTFYELDSPTFVEKKLVEMQDKVFLSNPDAVDAFHKLGCKNVKFVPMGFDPDFHVIKSDKKLVEDKVHFILMGKFEKRKHTKEVIQTWAEKYGNNNKYLLSCCVVNPFIKHEQMNALLSDTLDGKHYSNINFLPHLATNSEVNHLLNSADVDLTGLSGAEGWNLPSFNATALGKWSIVSNHSAHKAWATKDNSILLDPGEKEPAADGLFFTESGDFNQGNIHKFNKDLSVAAMEEAEKKIGQVNTEGLKLQTKFTYENTLNLILEEMKNG
jgi:hypothetical protein|tara:strand:- start:1734 stop:2822 length:1089 start_codon:yes stop_codon:yes gene_type:complete